MSELTSRGSAPPTAGAVQRWGRDLGWVLVLSAAAYFAAAWLGLTLRFPGRFVSALWPPNAVLLAALLLTAPRRWGFVLLAVVPAHLLAHASADVPAWRLVWQIAHNAGLTVAAAGLIRRWVGREDLFHSPRQLVVYVLVAVIVVPAVAALGAPNSVLSLLGRGVAGEPAWLAWRSTYLSNATAFLTLVPALVLWVEAGRRWRRGEPARMVEGGVVGVSVIAACAIVSAGMFTSPAMLYALLPPMLWAAARFGVLGVASALFVIAVGSILFAVDGRGPFATAATIVNVFQLQMFLFAMGGPMLMLGVLLEERARTAAALESGRNALRDSHSQIRDLARRIMNAQESERARIASELHDDVGQRLAALAVGLSHLRRKLPPGSDALASELAALLQGVSATSTSVRNLSHALHPSVLQHVGLADALRGHAREFAEAYGLEVALDAGATLPAPPPEIALCLFRCAQEGMRNIAEHAHASRVQIRLSHEEDATLVLMIHDDGRGFDRSAIVHSTGLGLVSLEERIAAVGGRMVVDTAPGRGTTIELHVPIRRPDAVEESGR